MNTYRWTERLKKLGSRGPIETDLSVYIEFATGVDHAGKLLERTSDHELYTRAQACRQRAQAGEALGTLMVDVFAIVSEVASRTIGLRPFEGQVLAGIALHHGKLVEMATGEGKTLAAVFPAVLNALTGQGVHVLTFNDYLARRDAAWMGPVYRALGLRVGTIQANARPDTRQDAYAADVTYATAKEAGFDFLRSNLCRHQADLVHRPFHFAIIDEADSILIDEARVPLVIAGERVASSTSPYKIASIVGRLVEDRDWVTSEFGRNVELTDGGLDRVETALRSGDLHVSDNYLLLTEVNQSLHAHVLLQRDVDYIVRDECIELVDEFTGRVVSDRRWPDGLQAALEAKEGLTVRPGGRILGSITLQHFLAHYPRLAGMTATAQPAANELQSFYGLNVVPISPNRECIRQDLPDLVFTHDAARTRALVKEICSLHEAGRPVLVGTRSVAESERLAVRLNERDVECRILNAKHDEEEASVIADAGAIGAVTISTNMAGRGTDIRLGGVDEVERDAVVRLGGLYVLGTNRHESRRIDDQLRGRAGRQGDPGASRFFVSLDDDLMIRYGIDDLVPPMLRPPDQDEPIDHAVVRRELDRVQRIAEGQNFEIRRTLYQYSALVEEQRKKLHAWRAEVLAGEADLDVWSGRQEELFRWAVDQFGSEMTLEAEREATLHFIDECWAEHLAFVAHLREGIHLVGIGGLDPLYEFHKQIANGFWTVYDCVEQRTAKALVDVTAAGNGLSLDSAGVRAPSSTWTYLVNDQVLAELQQMLFGRGNVAFAAGAVVMAWPILAAWAIWRRISLRRASRDD
jgi:preprotein translocase subunit SecA